MISLNIAEVKQFMAKLLTNTTFDEFILRELELQTFTAFSISGQFNEAFFSKEELEDREDKKYVFWSDVRQIVFSMIKGSRTPLSLKIVFQLPVPLASQLVIQSGARLQPEEVGGLYLNIRFEKNELHMISGAAMKTFILDKTIEKEWDVEVKKILKANGIGFEEE